MDYYDFTIIAAFLFYCIRQMWPNKPKYKIVKYWYPYKENGKTFYDPMEAVLFDGEEEYIG